MNNLEAYKGVFVFAQQVDNVISNIAYELIGKGKELAKDLGVEVTAVLVGSDVKGLADQLAEYGADKVIVVDDPELKEYRTEPYTHASVIKEFKPEIFLIGATAIGRDLGPRVCARIHTGLTADCTKLDIDEETKLLMMTRPAFGGNIMATIVCEEQSAAYDSSGIRRQHHRYHRLPGFPSADGNRSSGCYAESSEGSWQKSCCY